MLKARFGPNSGSKANMSKRRIEGRAFAYPTSTINSSDLGSQATEQTN